MDGDVAALDRFMRKVRTLDADAKLDDLESAWIDILRIVYRKYQARIGPQESYALSGGTLCICFAEGKNDLMAECDKAHREALFPRRRKAKHISIEDDEIAEPQAQVAEDEAVIGVLNGMDSHDASLLRERYMGERIRTTKELAAEYGISDEAMRQRQTRARAKFKQRYEKEVADDGRRVLTPDRGHAAPNGTHLHPALVGARHDARGDRGGLRDDGDARGGDHRQGH